MAAGGLACTAGAGLGLDTGRPRRLGDARADRRPHSVGDPAARRHGQEPPGSGFSQSLRSLREGGLRWLLGAVFLPFEAVQMLDAITTSLTRMFITHRNLLEWMTAAKAARYDRGSGSSRTWRQMAVSPLITLAARAARCLVAPRQPAGSPAAAACVADCAASRLPPQPAIAPAHRTAD